MTKKKLVQALLPLFVGGCFTLASVTIGRIGEEYRCQSYGSSSQIIDQRGIPLAYIKRSTQGTGCEPVTLDNRHIPNPGGHQIFILNFLADTIFWSLITLGIIYIANKFYTD